MRHFLYDEVNKRLVLVDGLWPSIDLDKSDRTITPNSNQQRIFNSLYIWENVKLDHTRYSHLVIFIGEKDSNKVIMEISRMDAYIIYGGAYQYNQQKIS